MTRSEHEASEATPGREPAAGTPGEEARRQLLAGLPVSERRLGLNGISTAVLEGGAGRPVILLHGPGEYAAKWFRVIPELAASHRVIAPDLPGHGDSLGFEPPLDPESLPGWLDDLIECTCQEPPVLVGQVLGGAIAARFAADRGERLRGLVLVDTLGLVPFQPAPEFGEALMGFLQNPTGESHDRLWSRCAFDLDSVQSGLGRHWAWLKAYNLDRIQAPQVRDALQALMERYGFPAIPEAELARIAVPTALIWGRHDLASPVTVAERAGARYGWPVHVIENAADDPPLEQPQAFLKALHNALAVPDREV